MLALWGERTNLTARPGDPGEIAFHVVDSLMPLVIGEHRGNAAIPGIFSDASRILDLGSGAGFPGLVLAAACDATFTLCESRRKRASFLQVAIAEMGIRNVSVESMRVRPESFRPEFDVVTARAVGDLPQLYRICAAALRRDGVALLYTAPAQRLEPEMAEAAGLASRSILEYELDRDGERVRRALVLWRKT